MTAPQISSARNRPHLYEVPVKAFKPHLSLLRHLLVITNRAVLRRRRTALRLSCILDLVRRLRRFGSSLLSLGPRLLPLLPRPPSALPSHPRLPRAPRSTREEDQQLPPTPPHAEPGAGAPAILGEDVRAGGGAHDLAEEELGKVAVSTRSLLCYGERVCP